MSSWKIRAPYPDELPRALRMLPDKSQRCGIRIAVTGRVERILAVASLHIPSAMEAAALLRFASPLTHTSPAIIISVLAPLVDEATNSGCGEVVLVGSIADDHPLAQLLAEAGFEPYRQTEIYAVGAAAVVDRVEHVYQRMLARGMIPSTARVVHPRGRWVAKLRRFLDQQQPTLAERIDAEEGFALEHSLVLLVGDDVKGAFFTRNRGRESYVGLMLIEQALRGGLPWANTLMMREMLQFGRSLGVERLVGEVHPEEHRGSWQIVHMSDAELICRRRQFRYRLAA